MNKERSFIVTFSKYGEDIMDAVIVLDQSVIDVVDDDWRRSLYPLHTPEDIAEHICYNIVEHRLRLSQMDGWANMDNGLVRITECPDAGGDIKAREITIRR